MKTRLEERLRSGAVALTVAAVPYALLTLIAAITIPHNFHHTLAWSSARRCAGRLPCGCWSWTRCPFRGGVGHRTRRSSSPGPIVITALLAFVDGWFGFFLAVCVGYSRLLLRWPGQMAGAAAAGVVAAISQTSGGQAPPLFRVAIFVFALAIDEILICTLIWLMHDTGRADRAA